MGLAYGSLFEKWEITLTNRIVREFKNRYKILNKDDTDDLVQDCLTHWYFVRQKFDPAKKVLKTTFMAKVTRTKLLQIIREYRTDKRKISSLSESTDEELEEGIDEDHEKDIVSLELKTDLDKALQKLTPQQKTICQLITAEGLNPTEIAKRLNIHRSTVYDELQKIREIFAEEGLQDYLK